MSKDIRHFILETVDFGKFDVVEYKEYQKLDKEIERLNNIIDELEKWLKDVDVFQMNFIENKEHITPYKATLDKLKALKEGKK